MSPPNGLKPKITTLLVDLGGVFFHPEVETKLATAESTVSLRRLMTTSIWMNYEVGKLNEDECFAQLAKLYRFATEDLANLIQKFRGSVNYDRDLAAAFRAIRRTSQVRIFLVSNISSNDYQALRERWDDEFWSLFDDVFTSSMLGVRKPSPRFYTHVLRATRSNPQTIFTIDDNPENVLMAISVGMRGTSCIADLPRTLANITSDPVERGIAFLKRNAGRFPSVTQDGAEIEENYAPLLILEALQQRSLVDLKFPPRLWNFFSGPPRYTTETYPEDLDTTSLGLAAMSYDPDLAHSILDEMLTYVDEDGFVQAYTDRTRPRIDAVISLNVLVAFTLYNRTYELPETLAWITSILLTRAYIGGTRYYPNAEWFLYYVTRLLAASEGHDAALDERLFAPLRVRVAERVGAPGDAFALGMRIAACEYVGVECAVDREALAAMQMEDGGWPASCMYLFPGAARDVGNRGASTAFAVRALGGRAS
ncbi:HAD-like protein [Aspergillus pseudoustus]|uniref:HAD-like protein n=1 Tax=Aspergillus pseudoustus TaxID=1810923 RepID=A0ABR4IFK0_9EURO